MKSELWVPAVIALGALYLWTLAGDFRGGAARYEAIGPDFFPKILLAALIAVSLLHLLRGLLLRRRAAAPLGTTASASFHPGDLALAVAITAGYVAALHLLGFLLATLLFQGLLLALVFRQRDWRLLLGVPAGLTALFFLIFVQLMSTPLPRGQGVFHELSKLLY